ncbi:hypothetical protein [Corallococcus sp. M7]
MFKKQLSSILVTTTKRFFSTTIERGLQEAIQTVEPVVVLQTGGSGHNSLTPYFELGSTDGEMTYPSLPSPLIIPKSKKEYGIASIEHEAAIQHKKGVVQKILQARGPSSPSNARIIVFPEGGYTGTSRYMPSYADLVMAYNALKEEAENEDLVRTLIMLGSHQYIIPESNIMINASLGYDGIARKPFILFKKSHDTTMDAIPSSVITSDVGGPKNLHGFDMAICADVGSLDLEKKLLARIVSSYGTPKSLDNASGLKIVADGAYEEKAGVFEGTLAPKDTAWTWVAEFCGFQPKKKMLHVNQEIKPTTNLLVDSDGYKSKVLLYRPVVAKKL